MFWLFFYSMLKFQRFYCSHALSVLFYWAQKFTKFCLFIHFRWFKVKSSGRLSLISIILWEYCQNNIKTYWHYSYENKQIISWKAVRFFFFEIIRSVPTNRLVYIFSHKNIRENKLPHRWEPGFLSAIVFVCFF